MNTQIQTTINNVITEILAQNGRGDRVLRDTDSFSKDLGFTSLDVAQLIATLEMELGVDPFSLGVAVISEVNTVARLHAVYEDALSTAA